MTARIVPHCAIRAKERYGIDLSWDDVIAIAKRCKAGEGRTDVRPDGKQFHTIVFGDRVLWVVYKPTGPGQPRHGVLVTIMPPEVGLKLAGRDSSQAIRRHREQGYRRSYR